MSCDGYCEIWYSRDGEVREWGIGCDADGDDEVTIKNHLAVWMPDAKFLGCRIVRVKDGSVVMDTRK